MDITAIRCGQCGKLLDASLADTPRKPCPECGSPLRHIEMTGGGELKPTGHLAGTEQVDDRAVGFFETERYGITISGGRDGHGGLRLLFAGPPPQGERDTHRTCSILIDRLNAGGASWAPPVEGNGVADCTSHDIRKPKVILEVQVVRAIVDERFWQRLRIASVYWRGAKPAELAKFLRDAIAKKATDQRIPSNIRSSLVLGLDATRLPTLASPLVSAEFETQHKTWARSLGFSAIWVVGPTIELCYQAA